MASCVVLVVGSGGRESCIVWSLAKDLSRDDVIYVAPGTGGTAAFSDAKCSVKNIALTDPSALCDFARLENVTLCVVGPEAPLAAGIVDLMKAAGVPCFGPMAAAAMLETSKS